MERLAGRVVLLWGWRRSLLSFAAGALAVLAQAPFDFFAVCLVSFPILVWLLDGAEAEPPAGRLRRLAPAFRVGWWFGFGYFLAGLWWIGNALLVEAESFAWALPLAVLALPAGLAVFYGLATAIARLMWSDGIGRIAAIAFGFAAAEWLRAVAFTGFPWSAIGYAAMPTPLLMQSVSVVGLFGMNALAVFVFAMPALLGGSRHLRAGMALALALVAAHAAFGFYRMQTSELADRTLRLRIVQASIDQGGKWDPELRDQIFRKFLELSATPSKSANERPDVIIWPETAVPFFFTERPDALTAIGKLLDEGQMLLAGAVRAEGAAGASGAPRYYNSILAIGPDGEIVDAYDKVHLVPFGEYLPFESVLERAGLKKIVETPVSFSSGVERRLLRLPKGAGALPLICYEIIFPGEADASSDGADLMINLTNDAWFGDTPGPYQHFRQAQVRAVETGLPLVRAANNGISAAVRADGVIIDAIGIDVVEAVDVNLALGRQPLPFGSPARNGLFVVLFFAIVACSLMVRWSKRRI